ncbi:MAG TPA: response regulator transcription factor [Verrucomicrobiae bacterium]|nr:response regulator transcription factor [Verrucomicrobiae bacterium]
MKDKTRIVIVDDHPIFRRGLREIIESDSKYLVAGESGDGDAAIQQIKSLKPDVAVVDLNLPKIGGLDVLRTVRTLAHPPAVIVLTMQAEESVFNAAMDAGAQGYLVKDNAVSDVLAGLKAVAGGGVFLSPSVAQFLVRRHQRASLLKEQKKGLAMLTPTERRILRLVAENKTNKEIARELFISHRTVETHRSHICEKLELSGNRALLAFAFEHKSHL